MSSKITSIASKAANNLLKKSGKEEKLAELLSANTVAKKSLDLTVSVFLNTFVHTTNSYIEYLNSQNSQIRSLMESTSSYLEKYEELSSQLDNKLSEAPLLNFFIEEHLSSLLKVKDNFDLVLFPLLDKDMIKLISQTAVEIVEQQEENFVGVSILTDEGKDGLKKEIQSHLKTISRLLPIFFLKAKLTKPDENEMKTFYKNLNGLSQAYTKQLVGEKASSFFKDYIDYQLQNSKLL